MLELLKTNLLIKSLAIVMSKKYKTAKWYRDYMRKYMRKYRTKPKEKKENDR